MKVLVLEKHSKIGGCTHTFEEGGIEYDTGVHYVGSNMWDPSVSPGRKAFDYLSEGRLEWNRYVYYGSVFDLYIIVRIETHVGPPW